MEYKFQEREREREAERDRERTGKVCGMMVHDMIYHIGATKVCHSLAPVIFTPPPSLHQRTLVIYFPPTTISPPRKWNLL